MPEALFHSAFIGPGGPEFLVVMLVLIVMFGAKDAPKMFRKMNAILNQVRNTADNFKREIMYGDLTAEPTAAENSADDDGYDYHDDDYEYTGEGDEPEGAEVAD
ncbi:MAG: hypothetical protein ACQCXQ_11695, partial [Verrucomicrobiales bacterium]